MDKNNVINTAKLAVKFTNSFGVWKIMNWALDAEDALYTLPSSSNSNGGSSNSQFFHFCLLFFGRVYSESKGFVHSITAIQHNQHYVIKIF